MLVKYDKLQNGSDIRGVAIEGAGKEVNLIPEVAKFIAYGFIKLLENKRNTRAENLKVAVGMDSRLSGSVLKVAVIKGLTDLGCNVYDCGMCTTPAMFMTTVLENYKCDGSIMITASHLPYYYNGLKFFTKESGCEKEDIKNILSVACKEENYDYNNKGEVTKVNFIDEYSKLLVNMIRSGTDTKENYNEPLAGLKLIVDEGNGAGVFFAYKVLSAYGREINKNVLIAFISSIVLEGHPNSIIVTDSVTSIGLSEFI